MRVEASARCFFFLDNGGNDVVDNWNDLLLGLAPQLGLRLGIGAIGNLVDGAVNLLERLSLTVLLLFPAEVKHSAAEDSERDADHEDQA